jgi:hypothetical protein
MPKVLGATSSPTRAGGPEANQASGSFGFLVRVNHHLIWRRAQPLGTTVAQLASRK